MNLKDFYKGKRVLITGHTGFKGSWLCSLLLELNAKICGIGLEPTTEPSLFYQLELNKRIDDHNVVDIRNLEAIKKVFTEFKPEIVIHMAAQPLVIDSYENPVYTYDVNVMGTVNVCECVRLTESVKSFINITTDKVYENVEAENHAYVETDRLNGFDPYSNSKSCSELITDSYKKSFFNHLNIAVSTCRAGNVIGGGDYAANRIIPDCVRAAIKGETVVLRNPNSIRPYQHVLEAITFYALLAMKQYDDFGVEGPYNVGPSVENIKSTKELCDIFCSEWGSQYKWISKITHGYHEANYLKLNSNKSKLIFNWDSNLKIEDAIKLVIAWEKECEKALITDKQIKNYLENTINKKEVEL